MSEPEQSLTEHHVEQDVDAAHARLRAHQNNLNYINSRMESNERRVDRIEKRLDDQSIVLADLKGSTDAIKKEVLSQGRTLERATDRTGHLINRIDEHIKQEIEQEQTRTAQIERLHRTIIRATTALTVIAGLLIVVSRRIDLLEPLMKILGA